MTYLIEGLDPARFRDLDGLPPSELAARGIDVQIVAPGSSSPCRLTLENTPPGETVYLLNFEHQPTPSPYGSRGPIFIRPAALHGTQQRTATVPPMLAGRILSARSYDHRGHIADGSLVEAGALDAHIKSWLAQPEIAEIHLHFPGYGCYAARVVRDHAT